MNSNEVSSRKRKKYKSPIRTSSEYSNQSLNLKILTPITTERKHRENTTMSCELSSDSEARHSQKKRCSSMTLHQMKEISRIEDFNKESNENENVYKINSSDREEDMKQNEDIDLKISRNEIDPIFECLNGMNEITVSSHENIELDKSISKLEESKLSISVNSTNMNKVITDDISPIKLTEVSSFTVPTPDAVERNSHNYNVDIVHNNINEINSKNKLVYNTQEYKQTKELQSKLYEELSTNYTNMLAETNKEYSKFIEMFSQQYNNKLSQCETTITTLKSSFKENEQNWQKRQIKIESDHKLEINNLRNEFKVKIDSYQNEILQFENTIDNYKLEHKQLTKENDYDFAKGIVYILIEKSMADSAVKKQMKMNENFLRFKKEYETKLHKMKNYYEDKIKNCLNRTKSVDTNKNNDTISTCNFRESSISNNNERNKTPEKQPDIVIKQTTQGPSTHKLNYSVQTNSNSSLIQRPLFDKISNSDYLKKNYSRKLKKLEEIKSQIEKAKQKKLTLARYIKKWNNDFQQENKRAPTKEERNKFMLDKYSEYNQTNKIYEKLKESYSNEMKDLQEIEKELEKDKEKNINLINDSNINRSNSIINNSNSLNYHSNQSVSNENNIKHNLIQSLIDQLKSDKPFKCNTNDSIVNSLIDAINNKIETKIANTVNENVHFKKNQAVLKSQLDKMTVSNAEKNNRIKRYESKLSEVESKYTNELKANESRNNNLKIYENENLELKKNVSDLKSDLNTLTTTYQQELVMRKEYSSRLQDLEGNIRVFCRLRPFLSSEQSDTRVVTCENANKVQYLFEGKDRSFDFDKCFDSNVHQIDIFEECKNIIRFCVDGFNVCLFAYGQTGSGKTFTMHGLMEDLDEEHNICDKILPTDGISPRSITYLFSYLSKQPHLTFKLKMSIVEIYKDAFIDLMYFIEYGEHNPNNLDVFQDKYTRTNYIRNAHVVELKNVSHTLSLYRQALALRKTNGHLMNACSSRSHLILSIYLEVSNNNSDEKYCGKLNLVDLAGSERVKATGAQLEMIKEAAAINQSLSCLQDVMKKLSNNESVIPYRNNKLTHYMSDSLGGNSKSLMFVNISPGVQGHFETQSSLIYASKVKQIKNSVFKVNENRQVRHLKSAMQDLEHELNFYKQKLSDSHMEQDKENLEAEMIISAQNSKKLKKNKSFVIETDNKRNYRQLGERNKNENKSFSGIRIPRK